MWSPVRPWDWASLLRWSWPIKQRYVLDLSGNKLIMKSNMLGKNAGREALAAPANGEGRTANTYDMAVLRIFGAGKNVGIPQDHLNIRTSLIGDRKRKMAIGLLAIRAGNFYVKE